MIQPTIEIAQGFQPAYEELKQQPGPKYCHFPIRFQPAYEELKHPFFDGMYRFDGSFQPAYEELKPKGITFTFIFTFVFSLPMRN